PSASRACGRHGRGATVPADAPAVTITLLGRPGCHLCDEARTLIARVAADLGVPWEERDITQSERDLQDYWEMIPVTLINGVQHDFWHVSEQRLRAALAAAGAAGPAWPLRARTGGRAAVRPATLCKRSQGRTVELKLVLWRLRRGPGVASGPDSSGAPANVASPERSPRKPGHSRSDDRAPAGVPARLVHLRRAGHRDRLQRGTRGSRRRQLGETPQGPLPPRVLRHQGGRL